MSRKLFNFPFLGKTYKIWLKAEHYANNNALALQAITEDGEPFADISVNIMCALNSEERKNHVCVDTNNLPRKSLEPLVKAGVLTDTGRMAPSGFVQYPIYRVDLSKI